MDMVPATIAPASAPAMAPLGPTHQQTMPKVNTPHEVLAAIADSAVATPTETKDQKKLIAESWDYKSDQKNNPISFRYSKLFMMVFIRSHL